MGLKLIAIVQCDYIENHTQCSSKFEDHTPFVDSYSGSDIFGEYHGVDTTVDVPSDWVVNKKLYFCPQHAHK